MIHEEKYKLRVSDFDWRDQLKPFAILDMFQSVADKHANILGIGYEQLIKKDIVWVLMRSKYEVIKPIGFGAEFVTVKTWPHPAGRVDFDRDYEIYNQEGELSVKATSKWCLVNINTRRICLGGGDIYPKKDFYQKVNFEGGLKKIADFDQDGCTTAEGYALESSLDHNRHVNNAKYVEFILDALNLNKEQTVKSIEINYLSELNVGKYRIDYKKDGNNRLIKGLSEDKESFRAVVEVF